MIKNVIPLADVLTPNIPEAEKITGMQISSISDMGLAACEIHEMGCKAVVIKGGHAVGNAIDILYDGTHLYHFDAPRIITKNTHGTGCTFSSAIAAELANGKDIVSAVKTAKRYVTTAIKHLLDIGKGYGPTNHFYELYQHGLQEAECDEN